MGTLDYSLGISDSSGRRQSHITNLYIWRNESMKQTGDTLHYYASRTPPANLEYSEYRTLIGAVTHIQYRGDDVVEFEHTHSDGAELCVARAILALQGAGLNV